MDYSAGIITYRMSKDGEIEIMLAHSGGPLFADKESVWTIPKGGIEYRENEEEAARREFREETGFVINEKLRKLGAFKVSKTKIVTVFYLEKDLDASKATSNTFEMEWPVGSGNIQEYPETDKAEWFKINEAKDKVFFGQVKIIERLEENVIRLKNSTPSRHYYHTGKKKPCKKKRKVRMVY